MKKKTVLRRVGSFINPLAPLVSMKRAVESGWKTIEDMDAELRERRRNPKIRTFKEAMAARSRDAMPLAEIQLACLTNRRVAIAVAFLSFVYSSSSLVSGNPFGALVGFLFTALSLLSALKYAHQSWQIDIGQASPDDALPSVQQFLHTPGAARRILNPQLFD